MRHGFPTVVKVCWNSFVKTNVLLLGQLPIGEDATLKISPDDSTAEARLGTECFKVLQKVNANRRLI
jgi:hypothetical protein